MLSQVISRRFDGVSIKDIGNNVRVEDSTFYDCVLDTTLTLVEFRRCTFTRCTLTNSRLSNCKFSRCNFQECVAIAVESSGSLWQDTVFRDCSLANLNWNNCVLELSFVGSVVDNLVMRDCTINSLMMAGTDGSLSFEASRLNKLEFSRCDLHVQTRLCTVDKVINEHSRLTLSGNGIYMAYIGHDHPLIVTPSFASMGSICESELSVLSKHATVISAARQYMGWSSGALF